MQRHCALGALERRETRRGGAPRRAAHRRRRARRRPAAAAAAASASARRRRISSSNSAAKSRASAASASAAAAPASPRSPPPPRRRALASAAASAAAARRGRSASAVSARAASRLRGCPGIFHLGSQLGLAPPPRPLPPLKSRRRRRCVAGGSRSPPTASSMLLFAAPASPPRCQRLGTRLGLRRVPPRLPPPPLPASPPPPSPPRRHPRRRPRRRGREERARTPLERGTPECRLCRSQRRTEEPPWPHAPRAALSLHLSQLTLRRCANRLELCMRLHRRPRLGERPRPHSPRRWCGRQRRWRRRRSSRVAPPATRQRDGARSRLRRRAEDGRAGARAPRTLELLAPPPPRRGGAARATSPASPGSPRAARRLGRARPAGEQRTLSRQWRSTLSRRGARARGDAQEQRGMDAARERAPRVALNLARLLRHTPLAVRLEERCRLGIGDALPPRRRLRLAHRPPRAAPPRPSMVSLCVRRAAHRRARRSTCSRSCWRPRPRGG